MLNVISDNFVIEVFIVVFLGMILGSFATAIVYRTRKNQSWIWNNDRDDKARSFCPSCEHTLEVKSLIPILSWAFQKGRCRYCNSKIPVEYILIEIAVLFVCIFIYALLDFTKQATLLMFVSPFFVAQGLLVLRYNVLSKLILFIILLGGLFVLLL